MENLAGEHIKFDDFDLDRTRRLLLKCGKPVALKSKTFDLLLALVENRGEVLTKDDLLDKVWAGQFVEEGNLKVQISTLRKVFGESSNDHRFIVTVPGRGYSFVADITDETNGEVIVESHSFSHITIENEIEDGYAADRNSEPVSDNALRSVAASRKPLVFLSSALVVVLLGVAGFFLLPQITPRIDQAHKAAIPFANAKTRQLTTKGKVGWAAISPDGKFFAYTLSERGEYKQSLWLTQIDGGGKDIQVREPSDNIFSGLEFSPDGKTLYFTLDNSDDIAGGLFKMPALGGVTEKLPLGKVRRFTLSPDGKQAAFFRTNAETKDYELLLADLNGGGERKLLARPADQRISSWKPAWSPDGFRIAFAAVTDTAKESSEIFVVNVNDGGIEQLTKSEWLLIQTIVWRPDGQGLIGVALDVDDSTKQLWHIEYPTGRAEKLNDNSSGAGLSISADGQLLLNVQILRESNIWLAPTDDLSAARQITFSSMTGKYGWNGMDWTPDGRIVFTGGTTLHSMDADGSDIRQITSEGFLDRSPIVSVDASTIFFLSNRSGEWEIWRVGLDGSDLRQLTFDSVDSPPDPTPDGEWIVYASDRDGRNTLWRVPAGGGESLRITDKTTHAPAVSPDGKLVACVYKKASGARLELALFKLDDGSLVRSFEVPRSTNFNNGLRFTPDGKAITYRDRSDGIWNQSVSGGKPTKLEGLPNEKFYSYDWSPDRRLFAFSRGREISDVVLISKSK